MYKVDPTLLEKFKSNLQTKSNNNDPNPLVYITRNRTPVTTQRFWEKVRVTATVGTRSSIAVRRPEGNLTGDGIFVAQVEDGNAVIRKAQPRINLTDMVWSHVTTLNNVSELSIMFDGYMKMVEGKVESYTTGDLPVVFYVDSDNSLKGWNMNTDVTFTISDTAYNVASVRGLYSEAADLNDGIFVFYTNASGELWEARILNDEVTELTQITLKPEGVTGWEDVWASLTFDYRVVLQLKGNDGNTYSLLSASRPSGFANLEVFEYKARVNTGISGKIKGLTPNVVLAINSYQKPNQIDITFDKEVFVYGVFNSVWVENTLGQKKYPIGIEKVSANVARLIFGDLVGLEKEHTLQGDEDVTCLGNNQGDSVSFGQNLFLYGIDSRHCGFEKFEYACVVDRPFSGEVAELEFLDISGPDETFVFPNISASQEFTGGVVSLEFLDISSPDETFAFPNISAYQEFTGGVFDINGIPI